MFPGIYEFRYDAGHLIFLGAFYTVFLVVTGVLAMALFRAIADLRRGREEEIRWREDFSRLPASSRSCRHEIAGEISRRTCPNGFDCRNCEGHAGFLRLAAQTRREPIAGEAREVSLHGFRMPPDRLYHRGHSWVRPEDDGTVTLGLDDFAGRLLGDPEEILLPAPGSRLRLNGTAFRIRTGGVEVRILSPLDGEVTERGGPEDGWYLRVRPGAGIPDFRHLLGGEEIRPWILRELECMQGLAGNGTTRSLLADGGEPVADLAAAIPAEKREDILGEVFLNP